MPLNEASPQKIRTNDLGWLDQFSRLEACLTVVKRLSLMLLLVLSFHFGSVAIFGQMFVRTIVEDGRPVQSTKQIRFIRYADLTQQDAALKTALNNGDELFAEGGNVTIELNSIKGNARFTFSYGFRLIVLSNTTINLLVGDGYVQAIDSTAIQTGVIMGAAHTEYAVSVRREEKRVVQDFTVFEGEVSIVDRTSGKVIAGTVSTGEKLTFAEQSIVRTPVAAADVERAATVNAIADTGKAMMADRTVNYEETFNLFRSQYAAVLSEPLNAKPRLDLAITQINYGENSDATYQLAKAEKVEPANTTLSADIAIARGTMFTQVGKTAEADAEFKRALAINPKVFDDASLSTSRLKPEVKQQIQTWHSVHKVPSSIGNSLETRWPVPKRSSEAQIEIFKLIFAHDYDNAYRILRQLINRHDNEVDSIDAYAMTILFFERQDIAGARKAASEAMQKTKTDGLLTSVEYDALKRNFEKPN